MNAANRIGQQLRTRQHGQLREHLLWRHRNRIETYHLGQGGILKSKRCGSAEDGVGAAGNNVLGTSVEQRLCAAHDATAGVDHVVDHDAVLAHEVADDFDNFNRIGSWSALVDNNQATVEHLRQSRSSAYARNVWTDDDHVISVFITEFDEVPTQDREAVKVINRDVEEALNLLGVKVDRDDAAGSAGFDDVGNKSRRDGLAWLDLLVLPSVTVVRHYNGDVAGRGTTERVEHDEQLHAVVVCRRACRLDQEDVVAARGLLDHDADFAVGETVGHQIPEGNV